MTQEGTQAPEVTHEGTQAPDAGARRWWVLVAVMVETVMGPLDSSAVNIALPTLTAHFGVPITTVEWVVLGYLLAVSALLPTFGRLGDMVGLKRVYLSGFAVFTLGSFLCALSWTIWALIGFRVLQALGAGMLFAVGPAIITKAFPPSERGKALGFVGVAVSVGLAVGPTLGGAIIAIAGWPWIFIINIPIGFVAFIVAFVLLPETKTPGQKIDPLGAAFSFLALLSLLLVLSKGQAWGWGPLVSVLVGFTVLFAALFVVTELRVGQPVLDLRMFRVRIFSAGILSALCSFVVTATVTFIMPFYLMDVRGFSVQHAGVLLAPVPLAIAVLGPLSGSLSDRIGSRVPSTVGLLVSTVGIASFATLTMTTSALGILVRLLGVGAGIGLFQAPNSSAVMGSVPRQRVGIASGMVASARNTGLVLGVALAGFVLAVREPVYLAQLSGMVPSQLASKQAFLSAAHDAAMVAAAVCLFGAVTSSVRGERT